MKFLKMLALIKTLIGIIEQLPLEATEASPEEVELAVRHGIDSTAGDVTVAGFEDIRWEEAIPHAVALFTLFVDARRENRRIDLNAAVPHVVALIRIVMDAFKEDGADNGDDDPVVGTAG